MFDAHFYISAINRINFYSHSHLAESYLLNAMEIILNIRP